MISFFSWNGQGPSGMATIIITLANYLTKNGQGIKVMCNDDSYLYQELSKIKSVSLHLIPQNRINRRKWYKYFSEDDCLVITSLRNEILELKKANPRIFFYQVYPGTLLRLNRTRYFNLPLLNRLLAKRMLQKEAVAIMDLYPKNADLKRLNLSNFDPPLLPVFVNRPYELIYKSSPNLKCLHVSYIGRSALWKILPAIKIFNDLAEVSGKYFNSFQLHIITDNVNEFKNEFLNKIKNVKDGVVFHENLDGENLSEFLCKNIDLHFGMGISVLEGAKHGIPSIIVDASYIELPNDYKYHWLFDSSGYEVGQLFDDDYILNNPSYLMFEMLESFSAQHNRKVFSEKSFKFIIENFSEAVFLNNFINYSNKSKLHLQDILPLYIKYYLIWS